MESKNISLVPAGAGDYQKIKKLYLAAFPKSERPPFYYLKKAEKHGRADFFSIYDGDEWQGFCHILTDEKCAYLFYLALSPDCRGRGIGSEVIRQLKERYKNRKFFLALETLDKNAKNYDIRVRRHGFYKRNGLTELPGHIREGSEVYDIMGSGEKISRGEYYSLMIHSIGKLYTDLMRMTILD